MSDDCAACSAYCPLCPTPIPSTLTCTIDTVPDESELRYPEFVELHGINWRKAGKPYINEKTGREQCDYEFFPDSFDVPAVDPMWDLRRSHRDWDKEFP